MLKSLDMTIPYNTFVPNNTHHASRRCTLWWVFDFYKVSSVYFYCFLSVSWNTLIILLGVKETFSTGVSFNTSDDAL